MKQFIKKYFWPFKDMQLSLLHVCALGFPIIATICSIFTLHYSLANQGDAFSVGLWIVILTILYLKMVWTDMQNLIKMESDANKKIDILGKTQVYIDEFSKKLISELRRRSGRPDLNEDPISMTAASLQIIDAYESTNNPLRAIIDEDLLLAEDIINRVDDGDDDF